MVLIKNCSKDYKHKRIPVSTQRYKDGGGMEKSVLDITDSLRHQKIGFTTSDSRDVEGTFVVKLCDQKVDSHFFNTKLPVNEDGHHIDKQLSYMNYKETVRKLHNTGWKKSYNTSADVSMIGYGCGVSMYPQFFVVDLYIYQMLPHPYLRYFSSGPGYQVLKQKWVLELANLAEIFVLERIESRIMGDDSRKKI